MVDVKAKEVEAIHQSERVDDLTAERDAFREQLERTETLWRRWSDELPKSGLTDLLDEHSQMGASDAYRECADGLSAILNPEQETP